MKLALGNKQQIVFGRRPTYEAHSLKMPDGQQTTVHVVRYRRETVRPRVVRFDEPTRLLDWCEQNEIPHAMSGGFFLRLARLPLGDQWINGVKQVTMPFPEPWDDARGALYINKTGKLSIAPRYLFPQLPQTDLMQSGPILVLDGVVQIGDHHDPEGFSSGSHQFDDDIAVGRFPRAAIGMNEEFIFAITCEGYGPDQVGMSFREFAEMLVKFGVKDALNLDGGGSATLINNYQLVNLPRGGKNDDFQLLPRGREIYTAVVFDSIQA